MTIQNAQIGDDGAGFDTAIDNSNGGTINLDGVTMTANNIDVLNDGEIDVTDPDNPVDHGVFLTGINNINSENLAATEKYPTCSLSKRFLIMT